MSKCTCADETDIQHSAIVSNYLYILDKTSGELKRAQRPILKLFYDRLELCTSSLHSTSMNFSFGQTCGSIEGHSLSDNEK
jgi:hypothetical protein